MQAPGIAERHAELSLVLDIQIPNTLVQSRPCVPVLCLSPALARQAFKPSRAPCADSEVVWIQAFSVCILNHCQRQA